MASRSIALGVVLLILGFVPRPASAAPILGGTLIATGSDVTVTYVADFAGDESNLYLYSVGGTVLGAPALIFSNDGSSVAGDTFVISALTYGIDPGEELVFSLFNIDENAEDPDFAGTENYGTYFTGPASRNPDNRAHAAVDGSPYDGSVAPPPAPYPGGFLALLTSLGITAVTGEAVVGFEDRPDCDAAGVVCRGSLIDGDFDYNDLIYAFSDVRATEPTGPSAPEPTSLLLFGTGVAGYIARRRKQQHAR